MTGYIHWLAVGKPERIEEATKEPALEAMQDFVGGFTEHVNVLYKGKQTSMFVHDEGATLGFPVNEEATKIYWAMSAARGVDLADKEQREADQKAFWARFGNVKHIDLNPTPDQPPMIHGNAIVLEGIRPT